ncbi:MAG: DNA polymerase III subunit epsilon [Alphaproteobacteria bacterium]|nr:DNA polymerase III subunit epsilon [Alphaproteobacteria bacterium]
MREIILDTETTGFHAKGDDRIIEIACLELINKIPTQNTFHTYINPKRDVPAAATKVHNITTEFLYDKPLFHQIADDFLAFVGDSKLIIHNAPFDMGFLNAELGRHKKPTLCEKNVFDTLVMARSKFPGANNTLDGLCKRFKIDLSNRVFHGALIDCELLAEVYVELLGGRQRLLFSMASDQTQNDTESIHHTQQNRPRRSIASNPADESRHKEFVEAHIKNSKWYAS